MEKENKLSVRLAIQRALGLFLIFAATAPAWGAIAMDQVKSTDKSSSASSITSPLFSTTAANELLLAFVSTDAKSAGVIVTGVTGASRTWALVQRTNVQMGTAEIWRAFAPSTLSSVSVNASLSQSVPASITVVSFTGVDTSGTNGSGAIGATGTGNANPGAPTASLVTTRSGSWVFGVGNDWDRAISRTLGPNQTMVHQYLATVGDTYWVQRQNAPTSPGGTTVTINDTAPSTDRYNLSVVEVLPVLSNTTFTVTGTASPASLVSGATVVLSQGGTTIATTTIGSNGSYTFSNIANGTYTVTPTQSGVNFTPTSQSVTVNGANATVAAFTATAQTWTVLGSITPATIATGATVTLSQSGTTISTSAVDSNGNYSFSNVVNGTYTVTPTKSGVSFSPTFQNVTVNNGNATVSAFTASQLPDLTILKTHSGSFTQGQTGTSYTITATNSGGAATSGTLTVTDTLPAGLTATAMSGTNWTCTLSTLTCTRNDPLAGGASYPAITLTVNVASNAPSSVTNTATVSGGGETNTSNDTANDPTTITPYGAVMHVGGGSAHPAVTNQAMSFNYTPVGTNNALVILIGCRSPGVTSMSLAAPGWTFTPISRLIGPSSYYDFIDTFGAITPNTASVTFTVTLTGGNGDCSSNDTTVLVDEFSGNDPTGGTTTFDAHNESFDNGVSGICTGAPVTPANNNDGVWYGCFDNVTGVSGGYTKGQDDATGDWTEYKILSGGMNVAQNPGFVTNPNFFSFGLAGISIKPAGGTLFTVTGTASPTSLVSGASVVLSQNGTAVASTTIGSNGTYTFPSVANGTYTVKPTKSGVSFSPTSQNVTVNNGNATVPAFTAAASGISLVQKNVSGNESTITSISSNFLSNNTAGNFLIVTGTVARPAGTLSISDTLGNTYTPALGPVTDTNQNVTAYIWYVPICKGGANTVTLTPATAAALEIHISEWTGLATLSPVDQTASATGTGTAASSGAATTTVNGDLIFGYTFLYNTATAGSGFTPLSLVNGDLDEYQLQSSAGSIAATFTQTSGNWFALMATFKPAGISGTTYNVSGAVSPAAAGYNLALSGTATGNTTTNSSGSYSFSGLSNGSYTVTPSEVGFSFTPASQNVTVNGNSVPGINFTAQSSTTGLLAIDVNVSKDNGTAGSSIASPAFSTSSADELLLALVATDSSSSNMTVTGVTGAGLTWTLVRRTNAQGGTSEIWRAFAQTTLSSVSVTASLSQSVLSSMTVLSFSGVDPTGPIGATGSGSAASGAPTASLITTRNNSWVMGVGNDFTNAIARTVPSNQMLIHQDLAPVGDTYWMQRQNSSTPTSGTSVTINDTAPTNDSYNLTIVEVLPASSGSGGGGTVPPTVAVLAPAPKGYAVAATTVAANASDDVAVAGVQFMIDGINIGNELTSPPYYMTWDSTSVSNGTHTLSARARDTSNLASTSSIPINVDNSGNPAVVGNWSSVVPLPAVAVNLVLLKNNKLLFYQDGATPEVWDYINNTFISVPAPADLFCSGHASLADGRILVVGGFGGGSGPLGISNAEIFDPATNQWTVVPSMSYDRWYPTATTLSDGRILVNSGAQKQSGDIAGIPELYDSSTNQWTKLTNANNPFETYPFINQLSDGRLIHFGGSEFPTNTDILDLNTQTWSVVDSRIVDGGSSAMYLPNQIIKAGSAADSQGIGPSSNTTFMLNMTAPSPSWQQIPSMAYVRSFFNLTALPDGTVLATGGETDKNGGNIANAVYTAELWSPATQTWTTMSAMKTPREYHGTALLLPDGRVVESGMGADFGNVPDQKSAEFYSPPYLFKGTRPTISQPPAAINYNTSFFVGTPDAASIAKVVLIRLGAVTHFFDENTRYIPLSFTQAANGLTVTAPIDGRLAPPGYYMLFLVNSNGVPAVAPILQVGP